MKWIRSISVLGAGAWGSALAEVSARARRDTQLWCRRKEHAEALRANRENVDRLPGVTMHPFVQVTSSLEEAAAADAIFAAAPAQETRKLFERLAPLIRPEQPIVLCAKGLEKGSLKWMSDVLSDTIPEAVPLVLSGPSFAREVARGAPAAVSLACEDEAVGQGVAEAIRHPAFRPYVVDDLIGAQVGGAVKNVLAIACGIVEGRSMGASAHAAVVTRGFAEMNRLGVALGAKSETLQGLCGLGDLMLTCSHLESRNMSLGYLLGRGRTLADIMRDREAVTEGVATAPAVIELARREKVEMPICMAVNEVLKGDLTIEAAIDQLLARPLKAEAG
ncbi:MAG: NAD(P)-dependent glycerol-3-phosphate dehydrogenase [Caulobacterales bacterium]|nr:NAD(P)-dependent glycerol-3-phosphate dehydrogenase [Caulobacterales bacterium]